jgi:hypothetical protein
MEEAFAPIKARDKAIIMADTWGHLAPKYSIKYPCKIIFTQSETGDLIVIKSDTGELPASPWLYEDMQDFVDNKAIEGGEIYGFVGVYVKHKNGSGRFYGKTKIIKVDYLT